MTDGILHSGVRTEVREIRSFLDEKYSSNLGTKYSSTSYKAQMPWARIGIEKFCDRIIPHFSGNSSEAEKSISNIMVSIKNAVSFGNSAIIVDASGKTRVSIPEISYSRKDVFGNVYYYECYENKDKYGNTDLVEVEGIDGIIYIVGIDAAGKKTLTKTSSTFHSIFYKAEGSAPYGRSRISPSIRSSIKEASRNKLRAIEAANFRTFPQWVINGIWEGIDPSVHQGIGEMIAGHSQVTGIPADPLTGAKVSIEEFSAAGFEGYVAQQEILAKEVAAAFNLDASELGVSGSQPTSADSLYATKEDLILEISSFERSIHSEVQDVLDDIAEKTNTPKVILTWQEPATPSKAAQADAFVKMASAIPQLRYSKKALAWAGLPSDLIEDIIGNEEFIDETLNNVIEDSEIYSTDNLEE